MSNTDPIADLCTRLRNGQSAGLATITVASSNLKLAILKVLKEEGYIQDYETVVAGENRINVTVTLKYYRGKSVITKIQRISKPGKRIYRQAGSLPSILGGYGVAIVSTSHGVVSDKKARQEGYGGEILCVVE